MSNDLHHNGKPSFYTNLIKMLNYCNIPLTLRMTIKMIPRSCVSVVAHMQKKYITHWKHSLCNSQYNLNFIMCLSIHIVVTRKNSNRKNTCEIINLISKQADMTRFRDVIEFVLFVASQPEDEIHFLLAVHNIHQLETTFLIK